MWKNKNVLITGATHFIASHLAERLVMMAANVKAFSRYDYQGDYGSLSRLPIHIRKQIELIPGSLMNPEAVDFAVKDADLVFHFGLLDMIYSTVNFRDYLEGTFIGTFNVLNSARKLDVKKFIHISNAEVYGKVEEMPIHEDFTLKAQSLSSSGDIGAEKLVEAYRATYNMPLSIARVFNAYGPIQSKDAVIPTIIEQALVGDKILLGNMHSIRDFVYVGDVVEGLIRMAELFESEGQAINIGSGQGTSINDLAEQIISLIGRGVEIVFDATRIRLQPDIEQQVADITKAKKLLGWHPGVSLSVGLKRTIDWFAERARG